MSSDERHRRADHLSSRARALYLQGEMDDALDYYARALRYDSLHIEALLGSAEIWTQQKRYDEIVAALRRLPSENPRTIFLRGQAYFSTSRYNEALADLLPIINHPAYGLLSLRMVIGLYARNAAYAQAIALLDRELGAYDPSSVRDLILERERLHDALLMAEPMRGFEEKKIAVLETLPTITRGDLAFLAVVLLDLKKDSTGFSFRDIPSQDTMAFYYRTATCSGFLEILPDGKFYPDHVASRRNVLYYVYRYAAEPSIQRSESPWRDVDTRDPVFKPVMWAYQNGIITPKTTYQFGLDDPISGSDTKKLLQYLVNLLARFQGRK